MTERIVLFLILISNVCFGQQYALEYVDTKVDASFRGLSVADEHSVWVSGSKGWVGRTTDGGENWSFKQVKGYEQCDFRSLYAFDSNTAVIANAGAPSFVLRTEDGGRSWKQVYENRDSAVFLDGVDFWDYPLRRNGGNSNVRGMIHGDPVKGKMFLLYTKDGGETWNERVGPEMKEGEASFAASGTAICCFDDRTVVVASGGKAANLYISRNEGNSWTLIPTPMLSGKEGRGIFSFWVPPYNNHQWLICGGDYKDDTLRKDNFFYTSDVGKTWRAPAITTRGYRECLASVFRGPVSKIVGPTTKFAVGPSGIDMSDDEGVTWKAFSDDKGFHVIKAGWGCLYLAGVNGKVAVMKAIP